MITVWLRIQDLRQETRSFLDLEGRIKYMCIYYSVLGSRGLTYRTVGFYNFRLAGLIGLIRVLDTGLRDVKG